MASDLTNLRHKTRPKEQMYLPGGSGGGGRYVDVDDTNHRKRQPQQPSKSSSPTRDSSIPTRDPDQTSHQSYLTYAPQPGRRSRGYVAQLDMLGFRSCLTQCREEFLRDMKKYVDPQRDMLVSRSSSQETLTTIVAGFLLDCGTFWWGDEVRGHLEEEDSSKGFLCPRDAERSDSRLKEMLQQLFMYRANAVKAYRASVSERTKTKILQARATSRRRAPRASTANTSRIAGNMSIVDLEDSEPEDNTHERTSTGPTQAANSTIIPLAPERCSIKATMLSAEVIATTALAVSSSNQLTKGPVILSLQSLDLSSDLFSSLFAECNIRPESAQKVEDITATFPFNGRKQRIRRRKPEDLVVFYSTIQKLWQKTPDSFSDGYEIGILIHIDD